MSDGKKDWADELAENERAESLIRFKNLPRDLVWRELLAARDCIRWLKRADLALRCNEHATLDAAALHIAKALGEKRE